MTSRARTAQVKSAARSAARAQTAVRRNGDRNVRQAGHASYVPPATARETASAWDAVWSGR